MTFDSYRMWEALGDAGFSLEDICAAVKNRPSRTADRNAEILAAFKRGETMAAIGSRLGLCGERIRQILLRYGVTSRHGGAAAVATERRLALRAERERKEKDFILPHLGCSKAMALRLNQGRHFHDTASLISAYGRQKKSAADRGILFKFTFPEWVNAWVCSGKISMRGRGRNAFCMARKGDVGAYEVGNVDFITNAQNSRDARVNYIARKREAAAP